MQRRFSSIFAIRWRRSVRCGWGRLASVILLGTSLGCQSDTFGPPANPLVQQFWSLRLNAHAITLALTPPYNQFQLTLTPRQVTGALLAANGTVVYTVSDTSVQVDSTGLLTAIAPDQQVQVIAAMTIGGVHGVTLADTAEVNVNDVSPVPTFTTLTLVPQPGDSARCNLDGVDEAGNTPTIVASALDPNGNVIPNTVRKLTGRTTFSYPSVNYNGLLYLSPGQVGQTWVYAEATVYGVTLKDSLLYTVTPGRHRFVNIYPRTPLGSTTAIGIFSPQDDTVAVGGSVVWKNLMVGQRIDVVFDNPPGAITPPDSAFYFTQNSINLPSEGGGNIPAFAACDSLCQLGQDTLGFRGRSFPTAGTYPYHSALYHTTGVIHVVP